MKKLLKKKIVLIPLVLITLYLVVVIIYYLQFSSEAKAFCDKKFVNPDRVKRWSNNTPEDIDTILFKGAAEKGYSVATDTQRVDPFETEEPEQEVWRMITPDGNMEWLGYKDPAYRKSNMKDNMNKGIKKYEENYKTCKQVKFFSSMIFTFGMLQYVSKVRGGGTYVFVPELFWTTPAAFMSMLP